MTADTRRIVVVSGSARLSAAVLANIAAMVSVEVGTTVEVIDRIDAEEMKARGELLDMLAERWPTPTCAPEPYIPERRTAQWKQEIAGRPRPKFLRK